MNHVLIYTSVEFIRAEYYTMIVHGQRTCRKGKFRHVETNVEQAKFCRTKGRATVIGRQEKSDDRALKVKLKVGLVTYKIMTIKGIK